MISIMLLDMPTNYVLVMQCRVSSINFVLVLFECLVFSFSYCLLACSRAVTYVVALVANKKFIYLSLLGGRLIYMY